MNDTPAVIKAFSLVRGKRWDHLELLEHIAESGSISAAASRMGMSYKAAWQAIESMNNLSEQALVERQTGGRHGGGTQLTAYGRRLVNACRQMEKEREKLLAALGQHEKDFEHYYQLIRRFDMKTSARNQFSGKVQSLKRGPVNTEVILDIGGGDSLAAIITSDSAENLGLAEGSEACALIKAPWVIVTTETTMKTSARNRLCGKVARCVEGAINTEVVIELPGGKLVVAMITNESAKDMELAEGKAACALIKASHVILAVQ